MLRPLRLLPLWSFLWPVVALGVFALLQTWRMSVLDSLTLWSRTGSPRPASAVEMAQLTPWWESARVGLNSSLALGDLRRLPAERPDLLARIVGWGLAMAVAGCLGTIAISCLASTRASVLPYSLSFRQWVRTAACAVALAWPWGTVLGALIGAGVWFAGFDRLGRARPIIDGLAPTVEQAGAIVLAWCLLMAVAVIPLLPLALARSGPPALRNSRICRRCGYPLQGLTLGVCPECGTGFSDATYPVPRGRTCHARIARRLGAVALGVACCLGVALASGPEAREWARLVPAREHRIGGWLATLVPGAPPQVIDRGEGRLSLWAEHRQPANGARDGTWVVRWSVVTAVSEPMGTQSGMFVISDRPTTPGRPAFSFRTFPFGELNFCRRATDPGLIVQGRVVVAPRPRR